MQDTDLRLDGNAAAGLLAEVFGAAMFYVHAPGSVLRCPTCTAILICVVRLPDGLVVDLSGVRRIRMV